MGRSGVVLRQSITHMKRTYREPWAGTQRIKVLLAHGQALFREGLRHLLEREGEIQVIGQATDGLEAAELCRLLAPDVLVMDMALLPPGRKGLRLLLNHTPSPPVLLLVSAPREREKEVREAIDEGVAGILGDCDSAELARSIRALYQGERFFSAEVARLMAKPPR